MIARTFWGAKADQASTEKGGEPASGATNPDADGLLDARIDDEGRVTLPRRGSRRRIGERLDPDAAETSIDELDLAVKKLSEGLEAIERQSRAAPRVETARPEARAEPRTGSSRGRGARFRRPQPGSA